MTAALVAINAEVFMTGTSEVPRLPYGELSHPAESWQISSYWGGLQQFSPSYSRITFNNQLLSTMFLLG
jgi:hypothetical protein